MAAGILDKIKFQSANSETINEPINEVFNEPINDGFLDSGAYLEPDPEPVDPDGGKPRRRGRPPKAGPRTGTLKLRKEVAAEIETYIQMVALPLSLRDEHCAGALSGQASAIAGALVDLLSRYPAVLEKFRSSGVFADGFALAIALKPVADAVIAHHINHTVETPHDGPPINPDTYPAWDPHAAPTGAMGPARPRVF